MRIRPCPAKKRRNKTNKKTKFIIKKRPKPEDEYETSLEYYEE
jgi:hypothetical protein